ncbi:MAG: hypothetical protein F6K19_08860 [Cyanothece sp. SIO1E1]|nr:hypothetical protein [Cyanothece sp. SIO1E1]
MKSFFIPSIESENWEEYYQEIANKYERDYSISNKRIFGINYYKGIDYVSIYVGNKENVYGFYS